ncbi:C40 family peptidase [Nocardia concava]|uniref:C40 family peptidase n=1 Tax=Nocardia concava TaxID=257281 RepID=UPI000313DA5E|nr:C40 family peptidase [Nocardia concava]
METIGDRQKVRVLPRLSLRTLVTGVLGAAAVGAALLFTAGEAHAAPVTVPGIGEIEIPNEIAARIGIMVPAQESTAGEAGDFRPVTNSETDARTSGVGEADASRMVAIPERIAINPADPGPDSIPVQALSPEPLRPATPAPAPEVRSVVVAGLGSFEIPSSLPPLVGIPGVTDAAAVPAPMPAAMPKRTTGQRALEAATSKLGANYRAGGNGPDSFDCSGFVQWSYREAGVELPRTSYSQLASGTPVPLDELQPGDLVSYYGGGHSAMYLGDGKIIHASDYGSGVKISPLNNMSVTGARRF